MLMRRRVGLEITTRAVRVAVVRRLGGGSWVQRYHEVSLAPEVFVPSWERENVRQEEAFRAGLRRVLVAARARRARLRLVLPDLTARLRVLESERPPGGGAFTQYVAWRLRDECVPGGARFAPAFYLNGHPTRGYVAVLAAAEMAVSQIERLVQAAGAKPVRITSLAAALFDFTDRALDGQWGKTAVLLAVAEPGATLIVVSDSVPVFVRTFRTTWEKTVCSDAAAGLGREVVATLDYCLERGVGPPERILLAGECAHVSGLASALAQHSGIPCYLVPNVRLLRHGGVPPAGIGALAAALC